MGKKELTVSESMSLDSVITYLEDLVETLKRGKLCVQRGDEFLLLTPASTIDFELEGVVKKDKEKINLELSWKREKNEKESPALKISSVEPKIEEEEEERED